MKKLSRFSTLTFSMLLACSSQQKVEEVETSVEVEVDRMMPMAESLDASQVEVTLAVQNPESGPRTIESIQYRINTGEVGGVLEGEVQVGAQIEANQRSEVKFTQSIPLPSEDEAYRKVLESKTIPIDLAGSLFLDGGDEIEFSKVGEVATPSLPEFILFDAQAARYGKEGVDVTIFLRLVNENVFPVLIEGTEYEVFIEDKKVKSEQGAVGLRLGAGFAQEFEVSTVLDGKKFEKQQLETILASGQVNFRVVGALQLKRMSLPFEHRGQIALATGE